MKLTTVFVDPRLVSLRCSEEAGKTDFRFERGTHIEIKGYDKESGFRPPGESWECERSTVSKWRCSCEPDAPADVYMIDLTRPVGRMADFTGAE